MDERERERERAERNRSNFRILPRLCTGCWYIHGTLFEFLISKGEGRSWRREIKRKGVCYFVNMNIPCTRKSLSETVFSYGGERGMEEGGGKKYKMVEKAGNPLSPLNNRFYLLGWHIGSYRGALWNISTISCLVVEYGKVSWYRRTNEERAEITRNVIDRIEPRTSRGVESDPCYKWIEILRARV